MLRRQVPIEIVLRTRRHAIAPLPSRNVTVPVTTPTALRTWLRWKPNWKSAVISSALGDRPGAFADIGANVGQTLADFLATGQSGCYLGFEPNLVCASLLQEIITRNDLHHCSILATALSDSPTVLSLHRHEGDDEDASATLLPDRLPDRKLRPTLVPCVTFDVAWAAAGDRPLSLVKIDVEGGEEQVLRGMSAALTEHRPTVVCEVLRRHPLADPGLYSMRLDRVSGLLADAGYTVEQIVKDGGRLTYRRIEQFPDEIWTPDKAEDCDYRFLPAGL